MINIRYVSDEAYTAELKPQSSCDIYVVSMIMLPSSTLTYYVFWISPFAIYKLGPGQPLNF